MEPIDTTLPVALSNPVSTVLLMRLAGSLGFTNSGGPLSEEYMAHLFSRMLSAKRRSKLSTRKLISLNRKALATFCKRYGFTRAEVRFAQRMVRSMWEMRRIARISRLLAAERQRSIQ
jgi:hypothetical protein